MIRYRNIKDFQATAKEKLKAAAFDYLEGGADDLRTYRRNMDAFQHFQIRPRRLVDVKNIDTSIELFGKKYSSPIFLSPVGFQELFHPDAELASVRAAAASGHLAMASTVTSRSFTEICGAVKTPPWFQLYTTTNEKSTIRLIDKAQENGCETIVLTIDAPVAGNREQHIGMLEYNMRDNNTLGNFGEEEVNFDPSLTWDFIAWFRKNYKMKLFLKGIMTAEDAALAVEHEVDGIIVSNHGGRQLESDLSTIEVLEEVVKTVQGAMPVFLDGGIRRGTDVFKALAIGATAVGIGRPYIYGLASDGQAGVERVLEILQNELIRNMRLAGTVSIEKIRKEFVNTPRRIR